MLATAYPSSTNHRASGRSLLPPSQAPPRTQTIRGRAARPCAGAFASLGRYRSSLSRSCPSGPYLASRRIVNPGESDCTDCPTATVAAANTDARPMHRYRNDTPQNVPHYMSVPFSSDYGHPVDCSVLSRVRTRCPRPDGRARKSRAHTMQWLGPNVCDGP